ncbi:hypothetical protein BH20CHL8_BH20CHL8_06790 [soil metagenome]
MKRTAAGLLVLLILLAACSTGGGDATDSDGLEHPTAADEAIFVIDSAGGFVPIEFSVTRTPTFVLLGDGRVVIQGMQTLEFPGPALSPLMQRTLTEGGIQEILRLIDDTNLFTADLDLRGAANMVADASDTIFTFNGAGREVTVSVYGLGTITPMRGGELPPGISSAEMEAHAVLLQLNDRIVTLDTWLPEDAWEAPGWLPYEPDALRLHVRDVTGQPVEGGDMPQQRRPWPTAADPAAFGEPTSFGDGTRCGVVEGEEAAIWFEALSLANQLTMWSPESDPDRRFSVSARPLLPHEDASCPENTGT